MSVTPRQVVDALKHRYVGDESRATNVSSEDLAAFIRTYEIDQLPADHALLPLIASKQTDWIPAGADIAVLHAVKDCMTMIYKLIDLEPEIGDRLKVVTPLLAAELLIHPALPLSEVRFSVFTILDRVLDATIGWSADQGRAGEKLIAEVTEVLESLQQPDVNYEALETKLVAFLDKEQGRIKKLEERLAASEAGKLRSSRGREIAAQMINDSMQDNQLPQSIIGFLQGPWFESMQLLAINKGVDGDDWARATKLTETIIWTYQPIMAKDLATAAEEKQRLYRIVEHLPSEVRDLLLALEHSGAESAHALEDIEADHVAIVSGEELDFVPFEPIPISGNTMSQRTSVSRILLRKVKHLQPGQWFSFDDQSKSARIKLVLKLEDVKQLLFTNRNGMKALEKSFDEMAYLMSSSVIKPLNHEAVFSSTFATFYQGLVDEHQRKLKLAETADQEEADRESARLKALQEAEALARTREEEEQKRSAEEKENRLERAKLEASKSENQEKVAEYTEKVGSLNVGAWLKLPAADGELEECKLAVRVTAVDKMIFVNRTGLKMGEYSSEQLITLLVAGECEIDDSGVEFEDTLAQVVSKLRQDRDKSYDDLTGS